MLKITYYHTHTRRDLKKVNNVILLADQTNLNAQSLGANKALQIFVFPIIISLLYFIHIPSVFPRYALITHRSLFYHNVNKRTPL